MMPVRGEWGGRCAGGGGLSVLAAVGGCGRVIGLSCSDRAGLSLGETIMVVVGLCAGHRPWAVKGSWQCGRGE